MPPEDRLDALEWFDWDVSAQVSVDALAALSSGAAGSGAAGSGAAGSGLRRGRKRGRS